MFPKLETMSKGWSSKTQGNDSILEVAGGQINLLTVTS